jgi:hypothetical protein
MRFRSLYPLFLAWLIGLASCVNKEDQWLNQYKKTKCAYKTEYDKLKSDSLIHIEVLLPKKVNLQKELSEFKVMYESKIKRLETTIEKTEAEYLKLSKIARDKQNEKYGHISTPDYEKKLEQIETIRALKINQLREKIVDVKREMESEDVYISITNELKKQEDRIKSLSDSIVKAHEPTLDSLQNALNIENEYYKRLYNGIPESERAIFKQKRDNIRMNPCNM